MKAGSSWLWAGMAALLAGVAVLQSPQLALEILELCLISAIMALGVNMQWGYAGLVNIGIMGFAALGGVAAIVITMPPYRPAWQAGGAGVLLAGLILALLVGAVVLARARLSGRIAVVTIALLVILGWVLIRRIYDPAVQAIEASDAAKYGYLGGLGLPIPLGWLTGGLFAAAAAWGIGKITLGLRSDYLAIATLGISEIFIAVFRNEEWLTRGVKNTTGLPQPVTPEIELQTREWIMALAEAFGTTPVVAASLISKLTYCAIFGLILVVLIWLAERALYSPWGRMMRAIRDNRDAAEAMGKDVKARHLQVFILGSAICGLAGAMLVTRDGQFTPGSYAPLRYTFLIWVMVIVGGSGNNLGSVLGAFLIWFVWIEAAPVGQALIGLVTRGMDEGPLRDHLIDAAPHLRLVLMGVILILTLRFAPRGLIPER